jgi:hypothetical protein
MNFMYQGHSDPNTHAGIFYQALDNAISVVNTEQVQTYLQLVKMYADNRYNWNKVTQQWVDLLSNLKNQYSTVGSRALPRNNQTFVYNTTR